MLLDSATATNAAKVAAVDPSWSLVTLLLVGGLIYFLINLIKNTKLTEKIFDSISTVDLIRKDQVLSNKERKEQGEEIKQIKDRLVIVENDVNAIKCSKSAICPNRE